MLGMEDEQRSHCGETDVDIGWYRAQREQAVADQTSTTRETTADRIIPKGTWEGKGEED